jgi:hypothetical protein
MAAPLETGAVALLFAVSFLFGDHVHPLRVLIRDRRSVISFAGGVSAAYVFVHLIPELHGARSAFASSSAVKLRYDGMLIYFLALVGFLAMYVLDHLHRAGNSGERAERAFRRKLGGFSAYVFLMAYLLVRTIEETRPSTVLYGVAIAFHFLALDHEFRREESDAYQRVGRFVLAGMCVMGWAVGMLLPLPTYAVALMVAFISGAIVMNSAIMELPTEKDGRFLAFTVGGLLYGAILVPLA